MNTVGSTTVDIKNLIALYKKAEFKEKDLRYARGPYLAAFIKN